MTADAAGSSAPAEKSSKVGDVTKSLRRLGLKPTSSGVLWGTRHAEPIGEGVPVINPSTGDAIANVTQATVDDLKHAVSVSREALSRLRARLLARVCAHVL